MKIYSILNGGISVVLEPETAVEEELLKALIRQKNVVTEVRSQVTIMNKNLKGCVVISKENIAEELDTKKTSEIENL
jgi:hypothetical protein